MAKTLLQWLLVIVTFPVLASSDSSPKQPHANSDMSAHPMVHNGKRDKLCVKCQDQGLVDNICKKYFIVDTYKYGGGMWKS